MNRRRKTTLDNRERNAKKKQDITDVSKEYAINAQ